MGEWCASQTPHLTQDHLADHKQQTFYQTNQTHNRPPVSRVSQTGFHRRAQWGYGLSKNRTLSSFHKFPSWIFRTCGVGHVSSYPWIPEGSEVSAEGDVQPGPAVCRIDHEIFNRVGPPPFVVGLQQFVFNSVEVL